MANNEKPPRPSEPTNHLPDDGIPEAAPVDESFVDFGGVASIHEGASGIIAVDQLPDPSSSASISSWTAVIRQQKQQIQSTNTASEPVKFDSVSDLDLLHIVDDEVTQIPYTGMTQGPDTDKLRADEVPLVLDADDSSDSFNAGSGHFMSGEMAVSGSSVLFDVPVPPSDAGGAMPMPEILSDDHLFDLPESAQISAAEAVNYDDSGLAIPAVDSSSVSFDGLDLTAESSEIGLGESSKVLPEHASGGSSILDLLLSDAPEVKQGGSPSSGGRIDLHEVLQERKKTGSTGRPGDAAARATQPELWIEGEQSPLELPSQNPVQAGMDWESSHDDLRHMEALEFASRDDGNPEEAVDLYAEAPTNSRITDSGSLRVSPEELEAAERRARAIESSAVDLSSSASLASVFDVNLQPTIEAENYGPASDNALLSSLRDADPRNDIYVDDGDAVDLDLPQPVDPAESSMIRRAMELNTPEEISLREQLEERRRQRTPAPQPRPDADESSAASVPRRGRKSEPVFAEAIEEAPTPARGRRGSQPSSESDIGPKAGKKGGGMLVGTLLGLLLGAGAFAGVWFADLLPNPKTLTGGDDNKPVTQNPNPNPKPPVIEQNPVALATPEMARQALEAGDFAKALEIYGKSPKSVAALAGQGQAKWLAYVQTATEKNQPLQAKDPQVVAALADLQEASAEYAKDPSKSSKLEIVEATLWNGLIHESLGDYKAAETAYRAGETLYPQHANVFTTARKRMDVLRPASMPVGRALPPQDAQLAFLFLLQAPMTTDAPETEAGFAFWDAVAAANKGNYADAIQAIALARKAHLQQRIKKAGKGLNPLSDPKEQIFERSCDDLTRYWQLCQKLYQDPRIQDLVKDKTADGALLSLIDSKLASDKAVAEIADKLMLKKDQKATEAIAATIKAKQEAEEQLTAALKQLKEAGYEDAKLPNGISKLNSAKVEAEAKLKTVGQALEKAGIKEADFAKAIAGLAASRDEAETLTKTIKQKLLDAKYVDANASAKDLLKGIDEAITRGSSEAVKVLSKQKQEAETMYAKSQEELGKAKELVNTAKKETDLAKTKANEDLAALKKQHETALTVVKTPVQLIEIWLPALADGSKGADATAAIVDAERVLKDAMASDEAKAKALAVKALAFRNQNKLLEAIDAFAEARKHPGFKEQPWTKVVTVADDQLRNPAADLVPVPLTPQQLVQTIDARLKQYPMQTHPKENAKLLAQRSQVKLAADDLAGAALDADAALQANGGADAWLASAKVAEQQRKLDLAEKQYREVMKLEKPGSVLRRQAQEGLARVLLKRSSPQESLPVTPKDGKGARLDAVPGTELLAMLLVSFVQISQEIPLEINEALKLGDELIQQKDYIGYIIKADAYARVGQYAEALKEYSMGIKKLKALPKEYDGVLDRILDSHPALQGTDDPAIAEGPSGLKFYAAGVDAFQSGNYAVAEQQFRKAIRQNNRDARYLYYLGLSRWLQDGKKPAEDDFRAGALLELRGKPSIRVISESLERVQGPARSALNQFRP